ncbi:MAG: biliverdin-producing heme oxygenase [Bacteroidota bacterium]
MLKAATRVPHQALERSPALALLLAHDLTKERYVKHLRRLYGYVAPTEAALAQVPHIEACVPNAALGIKEAWLRKDLAYLGVTDAALAALPRCEIPVPSTLAEAIGISYVLEGATLGGGIIGRHLVRSLGVTPRTGGAYYHNYGVKRGPRWRSFRGALDTFGQRYPDQQAAICEAAFATFALMHTWMNHPVFATT